MADKKNQSLLNSILEIGPVIIFFLVYIWRRNETVVIGGVAYEGLVQATAIFVPIMIISTILGWWINGELSKVQVLTIVLVVIFGALTVGFNNESFFKMKPTIIYIIFGTALTYGMLRGQNYIQKLLGDRIPMEEEGWQIISRRLAVFFYALAILNEIIWRSQTNDVWVSFKTFGLTSAILVFLFFQYPILKKYGNLEDD